MKEVRKGSAEMIVPCVGLPYLYALTISWKSIMDNTDMLITAANTHIGI